MTTLAVALIYGAFAQDISDLQCFTNEDCDSGKECTHSGGDPLGICLDNDDRRRVLGVLPAIAKGVGTFATGAVVGAAVAGATRPRYDDREYDNRYYDPRPTPNYPSQPYFPASGPSYYPSLDPLSDVGSENWGCQSNDECPSGANCYLGSNGNSNYCQFGSGRGSLCDDTSDCDGNHFCQYGVCMPSGPVPMGRRLEDSQTEEGHEAGFCVFHGEVIPDGEKVPAGDNCNTCFCRDGTMICTEEACHTSEDVKHADSTTDSENAVATEERRIDHEDMPWGIRKFFNQFNPYRTGNDWACPSSMPTGPSACRSDQAGKTCYYDEGVAHCSGLGLTGALGTWQIRHTEPYRRNEVATRRIVGPIATVGALALGSVAGAALVDVARNGATDSDSYEPSYAPRYNQPRYYPNPRPYYPSTNGVGSNNSGCQSAHECPEGAYCYLGDNGSPNFCGSIGSGKGSLCYDNTGCPWGTSCQYGVCRASWGRRLENEGELEAPEVTLAAEE